MDPKLVGSLAQNTTRLHQRAVALLESSRTTIRRSQRSRAETRQLLSQRAATRRERLIVHKLRDGRLPRFITPRILGGPGDGGRCDACDEVLTPRQLVMAIPSGEKTFVHLHADCFTLWNALRESPLVRARPA